MEWTVEEKGILYEQKVGHTKPTPPPIAKLACSLEKTRASYQLDWYLNNFSDHMDSEEPKQFCTSFGNGKYKFSFGLVPANEMEEDDGDVFMRLTIDKCPVSDKPVTIAVYLRTASGERKVAERVHVMDDEDVIGFKLFDLEKFVKSPSSFTTDDMLHVICRITIEGKQLNCCSNVWRPPAYNKPLTPESVAEGLASGSFVGPIFGAPYPGGLFEAAAAGSAARSSSTAGSSSASEETSDGENSSPRAKRAKCAKRNTQPTPRDGFEELFNSGDFSDFTIIASDGTEFKTHMYILSTFSEYFQNVLHDKNSKPFIEKRIKFSTISAEVLEFILRHIYKEPALRPPILEDQLTPELYSAVQLLKVEVVVQSIAAGLHSNVHVYNVINRLFAATDYGIWWTKDCLLSYLIENRFRSFEENEYIALHKKNRYFANELFDKCFMVSIPKEVADELARLEAERTKAIFG
ncbi:hypothetical protein GCK72_024210 [Caenorhabditis remanei]|uniref:BTB domain-containing protein n=1 Tax=Caenorhabditis remanei TaxID=31234 RepID=A0A6A5FZ76_CAERE|nr:hypothetical protein GCK72_024210 [Caenorhabditis remanei]KAF1747744.1 hypothetical protein GCK72_024210 [Caenorhabditis remanei]